MSIKVLYNDVTKTAESARCTTCDKHPGRYGCVNDRCHAPVEGFIIPEFSKALSPHDDFESHPLSKRPRRPVRGQLCERAGCENEVALSKRSGAPMAVCEYHVLKFSEADVDAMRADDYPGVERRRQEEKIAALKSQLAAAHKETDKLRTMLVAERGPGIKHNPESVIALDIDWD